MVKLIRKILAGVFFILITYGYLAVIAVMVLQMGVSDFSHIIPGKILTDMLILFVGIPILICLPLFFLKFITILNFKFMKLFQKQYEFYHVDLVQNPFTTRNLIYRAFLPVLMALAFSQLINNVEIFENVFGFESISSIIVLSLILAPIMSFLLLPIWVFKDSGIVRIKKKQNKRFSPELTYFGKMQHTAYKGFTGITTPIIYFVTIYSSYQRSLNYESLVVILYPFFFIGLYMPLLLIYEVKIEKLSKKIIKSLNLEPLMIENIEANLL